MEINYNPIKKLNLMAIYKFNSVEDLIKTRLGPEGVKPLLWANGIIFAMYQNSSDLAKEKVLEGIMNADFDYSYLENYKEILEFEDPYFKSVKARVVNYAQIPFFNEVTKWIKENEKKNLW
ncbi:MAG: hypothetical protein ACP5M9_03515 [Candidatus Micrarchaeia archaeon]